MKEIKENYPPIDSGTVVKTTQLDEEKARPYTEEGLAGKKWGVEGVVTTHHDSHGLCYDVRHEDGTMGTYEPAEISILEGQS